MGRREGGNLAYLATLPEPPPRAPPFSGEICLQVEGLPAEE